MATESILGITCQVKLYNFQDNVYIYININLEEEKEKEKEKEKKKVTSNGEDCKVYVKGNR